MADSSRLASISAEELPKEERWVHYMGLRNLPWGISEEVILLAMHLPYERLFLSDLSRLVMQAVLNLLLMVSMPKSLCVNDYV